MQIIFFFKWQISLVCGITSLVGVSIDYMGNIKTQLALTGHKWMPHVCRELRS